MKFQFQLFFTFILSLFSVVVAEELIIGDCLDIKEYLEKKDLEYHQIIRNCLIDSNQKVSTLNIYNYNLSEEDIMKLLSYDNVQELKIQAIPLTQNYIEKISNLSNIQQLYIVDTSDKEDNVKLNFNPFTNLHNLSDLHLKGIVNTIENNSFTNLNTLKKLTLEKVDITQTNFDEISTLTNLEQLYFEEIDFSGKDFSLMKNLTHLTNLYMHSLDDRINEIKVKFPESLKQLIMDGVDLTQINIDDITVLINLTDLHLRLCKISKTINFENMSNLSQLTNLQIEGRFSELEEIPESVFSLENLKSLTFTNHHIKTLSDKLGNLKNLEELNLIGNKIDSELPASLNDLSNLSLIDLRSNINIKGKTLTNASLKNCYYQSNYSLCMTKEMDCFESGVIFDSCSLANVKTNTNGRCGKDYGKCPTGQCCSKYGWCGTGTNYCTIQQGCQSSYGKCDEESNIAIDGQCGKGIGKCPSGECCDKNGQCGKSDNHCSIEQGCQSEFGDCTVTKISTTGQCGKEQGRCPDGQCCSKYGYCGTGESYCQSGCQSEFGQCQ